MIIWAFRSKLTCIHQTIIENCIIYTDIFLKEAPPIILYINIYKHTKKNNWGRNVLGAEMTRGRSVGGAEMTGAEVTGAEWTGTEMVWGRSV